MTLSDQTEGTSPPDEHRRGRSGRSLAGLGAAALAAAVLLLIVFNVGGGSDDKAPVGSGNGLEQFEFSTVDGATVTFATFDGQPLVVNYFAAWCGPCRAELPDFEEVHQTVKDDGIIFLGVSQDADQASWKSFIAETGVTYETLYEGSAAGSFRFLDARGMPTTVFITADGDVAEVFSGLLPKSSLEEKIQEHLING
jgi:peroxiredoxin